MYFRYIDIISSRLEQGRLFEQTLKPFTQGYFVLPRFSGEEDFKISSIVYASFFFLFYKKNGYLSVVEDFTSSNYAGGKFSTQAKDACIVTS